MQRIVWGIAAVGLSLLQVVVLTQSNGPNTATVVSAQEIQTVVSAPGGGDREIKILDIMGSARFLTTSSTCQCGRTSRRCCRQATSTPHSRSKQRSD
jgi:hypothetical protein